MDLGKTVAIAAGAAALGYYLYYQDTALWVSHYDLHSEKVPSGLTGYKIALISDVHNTHSRSLQRQLAAALKQEQPDLIVITGDLIDCHRTDIARAEAMVKDYVSIAPVYLVTGNHEGAMKDFPRLQAKLQALGACFLHDDSVRLTRQNASFQLIGLDDPKYCGYHHDPREMMVAKTAAKIAERIDETQPFHVLLSHRPDLFEAYRQAGVDLALCGHAHGGQWRIPLIGGVYAPQQGLFPDYTAGIFVAGDTTMIISRGIGNSEFPFRINNRPELVMITLGS